MEYFDSSTCASVDCAGELLLEAFPVITHDSGPESKAFRRESCQVDHILTPILRNCAAFRLEFNENRHG